MVRLTRFADEAFIEAAIALAAEGGGAAATIAAIARRVGAPNGSIYHRFESRAALLGTAWNRAHGDFVAALAPSLRRGDGRAAAQALLDWARLDLRRARFLLLNDAASLLEAAPPEPIRADMQRQEDELDEAFRTLLRCEGDPEDAELAARWRFLVFDGPIALVRPHLLSGSGLPGWLDGMIAALHRAGTMVPA
ncbi:MAG TPA: TetR family transcriptional regulator [Aliidongia sp.]|nr:TetR family transcriptional regulator [Aliidongia sp.]